MLARVCGQPSSMKRKCASAKKLNGNVKLIGQRSFKMKPSQSAKLDSIKNFLYAHMIIKIALDGPGSPDSSWPALIHDPLRSSPMPSCRPVKASNPHHTAYPCLEVPRFGSTGGLLWQHIARERPERCALLCQCHPKKGIVCVDRRTPSESCSKTTEPGKLCDIFFALRKGVTGSNVLLTKSSGCEVFAATGPTKSVNKALACRS